MRRLIIFRHAKAVPHGARRISTGRWPRAA